MTQEEERCMATLREVVSELLEELGNMGVDEETVAIAAKSRVMRESMHSDRLLRVLRRARLALAAPPRNCDRFNTGDVKRDAQDAMEAILHEGVAGYRGIAEYLLSPVRTKQEGDDNGSK